MPERPARRPMPCNRQNQPRRPVCRPRPLRTKAPSGRGPQAVAYSSFRFPFAVFLCHRHRAGAGGCGHSPSLRMGCASVQGLDGGQAMAHIGALAVAEVAMPETRPQIRPATAADAPAISALWNPIIRDTVVTFNPVERDPAEIAEMIATRQAGPGAFFRGRARGRAAGLCQLRTVSRWFGLCALHGAYDQPCPGCARAGLGTKADDHA